MCLNAFRKSCVNSIYVAFARPGSRPPIPAGNRRNDFTKNEYRGSGNRHYGVFNRRQKETTCFFFRRRSFGTVVDEIEPENVVKGLPNAGQGSWSTPTSTYEILLETLTPLWPYYNTGGQTNVETRKRYRYWSDFWATWRETMQLTCCGRMNITVE